MESTNEEFGELRRLIADTEIRLWQNATAFFGSLKIKILSKKRRSGKGGGKIRLSHMR